MHLPYLDSLHLLRPDHTLHPPPRRRCLSPQPRTHSTKWLELGRVLVRSLYSGKLTAAYVWRLVPSSCYPLKMRLSLGPPLHYSASSFVEPAAFGAFG